MSRGALLIAVVLGTSVAALTLIGHGWSVPMSFFTPVSTIVSVLSVVFVVWDKWLWRIPRLHPWPVARPDLRGTWRGEIVRKEGAPIVIYMAVQQTYSKIAYRTFTAESRSASVAASLEDSEGQFLLAALYRNEPDLLLQDRSRVHRGAVWLRVSVRSVPALEGSYWTDRDTKGEIFFERLSTTIADDLATARALCATPPGAELRQRIAPD